MSHLGHPEDTAQVCLRQDCIISMNLEAPRAQLVSSARSLLCLGVDLVTELDKEEHSGAKEDGTAILTTFWQPLLSLDSIGAKGIGDIMQYLYIHIGLSICLCLYLPARGIAVVPFYIMVLACYINN